MIPQGSSLADWPLSYTDLEPYCDQAEYELCVSGKAGNLQSNKIDGGNVFEAPRAVAVFRLITSSNGIGYWTGRAAGFSPLKTLPAQIPSR